MGAGIKIVLATDLSLNSGCSKELLLRWGGDPRCKVIFTSEPEASSLGAEVLSQINNPPVIVNVMKQEKVLLTGDELRAFVDKAEKEKKLVEEEARARKRELELSMVGRLNEDCLLCLHSF